MSEQSYKYLSAADTAKLVRKALKAEFRGIKFSVRSRTYAGGASIDVGWTDGPTEHAVKAITDLYVGSHGEQNGGDTIKMPHDSLLIDGDGNLEIVHFGADYIFTRRELSTEWRAVIARRMERLTGLPCDLSSRGDGWNTRCPLCIVDGRLCRLSNGDEYGNVLVHRYTQSRARVPVWAT